MQKQIAVAVVGCGYWGPNLVRNYASLDECQVSYICDPREDRLRHMSKLFPGIKGTTRYEEVLNDKNTEAVALATPVSTHYELARAALEAGKHVFIEKPMATSCEDCVKMLDLAQMKNLVLMIGHTFLFTPVVKKIKEIIDHGDLGDILYISARRLNLGLFQTDINVAWDLAPHDISIILYILNEMPESVNCQGKAHINKGIEDVVSINLNFTTGSYATIHNSWLDPSKVREMTFVGDRRMLIYNDIEPIEKIKIYDKRVETPPHYDTFAEFHYSYHYGDMFSPYLVQVEPLKNECKHFIDCIRTGQRPVSDGEMGLKIVSILEAASASLKQRGSNIILQLEQVPA